MRWAYEKGIETWISLEPVLDLEESLRIIKETHDYVDHYKIGTLNHVRSSITPAQWGSFGRRAINLCTAYNRSYYIKHDLAKHLGDFPFANTDTRRARTMDQKDFSRLNDGPKGLFKA